MQRFQTSQPVCALREHDPGFGVVFERGQNASLWDVDGRRWIDLTCGYSATNFGHAYEPLVRVAQRQLETLSHLTGEPHVQRIVLSELLIQECWKSRETPAKVTFNSSGARAIETALKAATSFRPGRVVAMAPSLHGRTIATSALSDTRATDLTDAFRPLVHVVEPEQYPYCTCCPLQDTFPDCRLRCAANMIDFLKEKSNELSAVLIEPVLTARGYLFPPKQFFHELRSVTRERGILLIADEIQAGMGRTAPLARSLEDGWMPDLLVFGKSLGGGMVPAAAVVGSAEILDSIPKGAESETHAGSPLSCAVARCVVEMLRGSRVFEKGCSAAQSLRNTLRELSKDRGFHVEGDACAVALEFAANAEPAAVEQAQQRARYVAGLFAASLLRVQLTGPRSTRIVMLPPLTILDEELEIATRRIVKIMQDIRL